MKGNLYLVATPIGNLDDITIIEINILKDFDIIAAEDTRHTLKLLNHLKIKKPLTSYYKQTEKNKSNVLINKLLEGQNIALVSDAGTPGISDPGEEIVRQAIKNEIEVIPIPGACALINALICSGMNTTEFSFIGFLPVNQTEKRKKLEEFEQENKTLIFYEAPHKLLSTLQKMLEIFGNRKVVLARELTKIHEEYIRGTLEDVLQKQTEPKGEYVIIVEGNKERQTEELILNGLSLESHYEYYKNKGLSKKETIKAIASDRKTNKNEIYQYFLNKDNENYPEN